MATISFWARITSGTANADTLVIGNDLAVQITFNTDNPNTPAVENGDLALESTAGGFDPDTWVTVNGISYTFIYDVVGTVPIGGGGNKFPASLQGKQIAVIELSNGTKYFFVTDGTATQAQMNPRTNQNPGGIQNGNQKLDNANIDPPPLCFVAGTDIATPSGLRKVESLRPGDTVLTEDGRIAQVAWVGVTRYETAELMLRPELRAIRIPANAFGPGLPVRDLEVSPQHRVVVEGPECELLFGTPRAFVIAHHLLGTVARRADFEDGVNYIHLMLDSHENVVSNGLPTESYQPARRMLDIMSGENLERLEAALEVLGKDEMLNRPDALPTMSSREAKVYLAALKPATPTARADAASVVAQLH